MRTNKLLIRTPEGISFTQRLAGPVTRFLAFAIDLAGITLISGTLSQVLLLAAIVSPDFALAARSICYFVVTIGYSILFESLLRGQTLGKRVLKIRVVDAEGFRLRPAQIVVRNLLRVIDLLPAFYAVGGLCCLLSPKYQRMGDIAANTVVIYTAPEKIPDLELLFSGSYNSLRDHAHIGAQLRKLISPTEARLALEAVSRRAELEPESRLELYRQLAQRLRSIITFPEEALAGMTDEQYVRNIVDLIYRPTL
ncbi:MAG: RDD family protein [Verrucomicrobia bacterium]|nr:RDD family protein [Verrucomicrobiota bacterium]